MEPPRGYSLPSKVGEMSLAMNVQAPVLQASHEVMIGVNTDDAMACVGQHAGSGKADVSESDNAYFQ